MRYVFIVAIFGALLGCGSSSNGDDEGNDDTVSAVIEHPMSGKWVSNCFKAELHTDTFSDVGIDNVWLKLSFDISNGEMETSLESFFGEDCISKVSNEIDLYSAREDRSGPITIQAGNLSFDGYEYASYIYNGIEESSLDIHIAIVDGVPYWVRLNQYEYLFGSGERQFNVWFDIHFSKQT